MQVSNYCLGAVLLLTPMFLGCSGATDTDNPSYTGGEDGADGDGGHASTDLGDGSGGGVDIDLNCEGAHLTPAQATSSLEGIYEIAEWTKNPDNCDGEGSSILAGSFNTMLWLKFDDSLGCLALKGGYCTGLTDCRTSSQATTLIGNMTFEAGNDADGWAGEVVEVTFAGRCFGSIIDRGLTSPQAGTVRIERIETQVAYVPLPSGSEEPQACLPEQVPAQAVTSGICAVAEFITATRVDDLP